MKILKFGLWFLVLFLLLILVFRHTIKDRLTTNFYQERSEVLYSLDFSINDYFSDDPIVSRLVDRWYEGLTTEQRLAQLVMPAYDKSLSKAKLVNWIKEDYIGGFMLLRSDLQPVDIEAITVHNKLPVPLLVSADAEPSLLQYRFPKLNKIVETSSLTTPELIVENAEFIVYVLQRYGINLNFAPVYDVSKNRSVIGNRSFGDSASKVSGRANLFSEKMKAGGILATAKHFPGHGNVEGDTHNSLLMIEGDLTELEAFESAIHSQVPVMMVGHLAVGGGAEFHTEGLPATLSPQIMKKLLREDLGFKGVVITDAMNMGAVKFLAEKDLRALKAGADIVLMPSDPVSLQRSLLREVKKDSGFAIEVEKKVKRVLRLKIAWRLSQQREIKNEELE